MYNSKLVECRELINKTCNFNKLERHKISALFVNSEIVDEFSEFARKFKTPIVDEQIWNFDLCIDGIEISMNLIWIQNDDLISPYISEHLPYSYPWKRCTTIYMPVKKIALVEKFVQEQQLEQQIMSITTDRTRIFFDEDVRLVQFKSRMSPHTLRDLGKYLKSHEYEPPNNRLIKIAFSYLEPEFLKYFDKPFYNPDSITQVLLVLDYHRANRRKGVEIFNIFDLIAMKMAIDDNRYEYENCEFHKLIRKTIGEMTEQGEYIKSGAFDLADYRSDRGIFTNPIGIEEYLIYNFNSQFDHVVKYANNQYKLKLTKDIDIDAILKYPSDYITLNIDSAQLNVTSPHTLLKFFLNDRDYFTIIMNFETDNAWYYDTSDDQYSYVFNKFRHFKLHFMGTNCEYFIENFFNWLKSRLGTVWKNFNLAFLGTRIFYPYILNDIFFNDISLHDMELDSKLIHALVNSKYQRLMMFNCKLPNDYKIFEAIIKLRRVWHFTVVPNEYFFEIFTEYLENSLILQNKSEIKFQTPLNYRGINFKGLKFVVNSERTKIEAISFYSNEIVNIYDYLYDDGGVSRDNFDFYQ